MKFGVVGDCGLIEINITENEFAAYQKAQIYMKLDELTAENTTE